jgi:hypothetical protein
MSNYLNYDAESILTRLKLNIQNSETFSDQLFDGSNLSVLLETLSLMFEQLTYIVNNEATQASFGDATVYEAINKLVKKLSYNPRGPVSAVTSTTTFTLADGYELAGAGDSTKIFPKFIRFRPPTGKTVDANGNDIFYSLVEDHTLVYDRSAGTLTTTDGILFYNGVWTKYDTQFVTTGTSNETFELEIDQSSAPVSDLKLFAYYEQGGTYHEYRAVRNLFDYGPTDDVFEVRVNEDKELTIRFGDGVTGSLLPSNASMFFVYLKSNGSEGEIGKELINVPQDSPISFWVDGIDYDDLKDILGINPSDLSYIVNDPNFYDTSNPTSDDESQIVATIDQVSTTFATMETASEIKETAPTFFRSGGRLLTAADFKNYIAQYYTDTIHDSTIHNNWEYMSTFMKWLYELGYLVPTITALGYKYADSCDFNNIYVWLQPNSSTNTVSKFVKNRMDTDMKSIKVLTSETVFLDSIKTYFWPYVGSTPSDIASNTAWPDNDNTVIRIERDPNSLVSIESIRSKAIKIFTDYFSYTNNSMGEVIDASEIYESLLALNGVTKVQTTNGTTTADGVSLARWTNEIVEGSDFVTFTGASTLQSFQFPVFYDTNSIIDKLEIADSNYSSGGVEY